MTIDAPAAGSALQPIGSGERLTTLDTLRGVAVLGILLLNIVGAGLGPAYSDPSVLGGATGANLYAWAANELLFEGTMRGLFSLLFGAGVVLLVARGEATYGAGSVADIYYRRTIWLVAFGLVHGYLLLWIGDVLYVYGLVGLFLYPLRRLAPRTLILTGVISLFAVTVPFSLAELEDARGRQAAAASALEIDSAGGALSAEQTAALESWQSLRDDHQPGEESVRQTIDGMQGGYLSALVTVAPIVLWFQTTLMYESQFWDALGMMLIGMALLKLGVLTAQRSIGFYLTMMLLGYGIGLAVNVYELRTIVDNDFDLLAQLRAALTYDLGRLPMTLAHLATVMLVCRLGWWRGLQRRLAAVGRMALTNYILQTLIANTIFVGFALFGELQRYALYYIVAAIWLVQLVASPLWLQRYRFGPLEWLWRSLTYLERQPMRRIEAPIRASAAG